jgi:beta-lactamase regulating signal transducer with metallopeptidase domain/DUF4097 and DUF4098 domain-containing protein YvlB
MSNVATIAVDLVVRVTLLFGLGFLATVLLHRRSAAIRHLVLAATLGGSLFMAGVVPWSPRLDIPLQWWKAHSPVVVVPAPNESTEAAMGSVATTARAADTRGIQPATHRSLTSFAGRSNTPSWLLLWLAGAGLVLLWVIAGRIGLVRLARHALPVTHGPWPAFVEIIAASLGTRRSIRILMSAEVGTPMTWGAWRPVLVVPPESVGWDDDLRQSVTAHEVAHIARYDYPLQVMATVACAVFWFHPLAWMLARRMRQAAERACDDQVLSLGTAGEDYATHLIGIARDSRNLRLAGAVAIGMARAATLEGRIVAVLDPARRRDVPTAGNRGLVMLATAVALLLVGAIRPVPVSAKEAYSVEPTTDVVNVQAPIGNEASDRTALTPKPQSVEPRQGQPQSQEHSLTAAPGEELVLDLKPGGDVTVRGWDQNRVVIRSRLGGPDWRDVEVSAEREAGGVRVRSRFLVHRENQSTDSDFEIQVPRRFDVRINSGGGSLTLIDLEGRFSGTTGGGEIVLERLSGSASLSTGGGNIRVSDSNLSGRVGTGGGMVRLSRVSGGLRGSSGSGPVIYGEGASASSSESRTANITSVEVHDDKISVGKDYSGGRLNIQKAGGDVNLDAAPNGVRIHTGGGEVTVGQSARLVEVNTGGGDIRIGPASGSVQATTGAGEVRIIVDDSRDATQVIEVWSGFGKVIVELPANYSGRLDLETAHTRTHEATARIRSDFPLNEEPLTDWESRAGTPRRYLRATGTIGSGDGRVKVRTVNGEIEIRKR